MVKKSKSDNPSNPFEQGAGQSSGPNAKEGKPFDGLRSARELLEGLDAPTRDRILKEMTERAPEVAKKIQSAMTGFKDLLALSDSELGQAIRKLPLSEIALAIKNQSDETINRIKNLLPKRTQEELNEILAQMGKRKLMDVEAAQKKISEFAFNFFKKK